jgi:hypothetical protein
VESTVLIFPLERDHPYKATFFLLQKGWPYKKETTVIKIKGYLFVNCKKSLNTDPFTIHLTLKHAVNCKAVNGKIRFIAKTIFAKNV